MTKPHLLSWAGSFFGTIAVAAKMLTNNSLAAGVVYTAGSLVVTPIVVTGIIEAHDAALRHEADDRARFESAGSPRPARQGSVDDHRAPSETAAPAVNLAGRLPSLLLSRTSFLLDYEGDPGAAASVRSHLDGLIAEGLLSESKLTDAEGEMAREVRRLRSLDQRLIALRTSMSSAGRMP